MFLFNIFKGSQSNLEEQKLDRIHFKISLNDHVPRYEQSSDQQAEEEEELTPAHPLYHTIFPQAEEECVQYVTNENDTLFGLAIKLDISEKTIKSMNNISGNIYPGMRIKLPLGTDLTKLQDQPTEKPQKVRMSQLLKQTEKHQEIINLKYNVSYYAGLSGYIRGSLIINPSYLIFNPNLDHPDNLDKFTVERLLKFNAIVEIEDIQDICSMQLPEMSESQIPSKINVIQFLLYRVGNAKIEMKYKERLKQLKLDHKAIASVSFTVEPLENKSAHQVSQELLEKMQSLLKENQNKNSDNGETEQKNHLTNIPFFDIIHANIQPKNEEEKPELDKIIHKNTILGNLLQPSQIISPQQFSHLAKNMPVLYQLYNWTMVYNATRDGTSFTTFLNKCQGVEPALLLIKEYKGYSLGAFLIQNLETGKTGRGEMYIFTFRDQTTPEIYQWTGKNQTFVVCEKDSGIGIGMGFKYGIFLKNDLSKGSCSSTQTFGNENILSKKQDFVVEEVEVWGIDSSF